MKEGKKVNRKEGRKEGHTANRKWILPVYSVRDFIQSKMRSISLFILFYLIFLSSSIHVENTSRHMTNVDKVPILSNARCVTLNCCCSFFLLLLLLLLFLLLLLLFSEKNKTLYFSKPKKHASSA